MKPLSSKVARPLIVIAYLLPVLIGIFLLIWANIPHLFFFDKANNDPKMSQGLFDLMGRTWDACVGQLNGSFETTPFNMYFPYIMIFAIVVSWLCIFLYAVTVVPTAVCSILAFAYPPTSKNANLAKRWLHFFCPNRITYIIFQLLILVPACFPILLESCQQTMFPEMANIFIYYDFVLPDWLLVGALTVIGIAFWLILLPAQRDEHMDMYRLYKAKK